MLTKRQKQILDFITSHIKKEGYSPSLEEIRRRFRLSSKSTIHQHVATLKAKGYLTKTDYRARSIEPSKKRQDTMVSIPLLGTIAAGSPIEAVAEKETIVVPRSKLAKNENVYALRVVGNSMIDEDIKDGDVILVKQQEIAENGWQIFFMDEYGKKLELFNQKYKTRSILKRKRCPICSKKEDADGRCDCVNKDA